MNTEKQHNEIISIVESHGYKFKGIKQHTKPALTDPRLVFEKDFAGSNITISVNIPKSTYSAELGVRSSSVGVHSYEQLKESLSAALPNHVDRLRRKVAGEDVD